MLSIRLWNWASTIIMPPKVWQMKASVLQALTRMGELAPSVLGDMMRGGSTAAMHWADRLAENEQHYQWIRRQALRRVEELTFKEKRK